MSQKYIKSQNKNSHNAKSYGKYYAKPVYDEKFIETDEIAQIFLVTVCCAAIIFIICGICGK